MRFLIDTNVASGILRRNHKIGEQVRKHHTGDIGLSSIVVHELYFGAYSSSRAAMLVEAIEELNLPVLPFSAEDARAASDIRARLRRSGKGIGAYDVLIAGQALARDLIVVTHNVREFSRVAGLRIEDWEA